MITNGKSNELILMKRGVTRTKVPDEAPDEIPPGTPDGANLNFVTVKFQYLVSNLYIDIDDSFPSGTIIYKKGINPGLKKDLSMDPDKNIFNNLWVGSNQPFFYKNVKNVNGVDITNAFTQGRTKICKLNYDKSNSNDNRTVYTGEVRLKIDTRKQYKLLFEFYNNPISNTDWSSREYFVDAINRVNRIRDLMLNNKTNQLFNEYKIRRNKDFFKNIDGSIPTKQNHDKMGQYQNIKFNLHAKKYLRPLKGDQYYLACQGAIIPRDKRLKVDDIEYNLCKLDYDGDSGSIYSGNYNVTLVFPVSNQVTNGYKYSYLKNPKNGTNWITKERLIMESDESNPWNDRILDRITSFDASKYPKPDDDSSRIYDQFGNYRHINVNNKTLYHVTFTLDPEDGGSSSDNYYLAGGFVGNANAIKMKKNGSFYETAIKLPEGFTGNYTYTKNPKNFKDWSSKENLPTDDTSDSPLYNCGDMNNFNDRILPIIDSSVGDSVYETTSKKISIFDTFGACKYDGPVKIKISSVYFRSSNKSNNIGQKMNIKMKYNTDKQFINIKDQNSNDHPNYKLAYYNSFDWQEDYNIRVTKDEYVVMFKADRNPDADKSNIIVNAKRATGSEVSTKFQDNASLFSFGPETSTYTFFSKKTDGKNEWEFGYEVKIGDTKNPTYRQSTITFPTNYQILDDSQRNIGNSCSIILSKVEEVHTQKEQIGIKIYKNKFSFLNNNNNDVIKSYPVRYWKDNIFRYSLVSYSESPFENQIKKNNYMVQLLADKMTDDDFNKIKVKLQRYNSGGTNFDIFKAKSYTQIPSGENAGKYLLNFIVKQDQYNDYASVKTFRRNINILLPKNYKFKDNKQNIIGSSVTVEMVWDSISSYGTGATDSFYYTYR